MIVKLSETVETGLPCPHCPSSDAYATYDDGHGYCYSCQAYDPAAGEARRAGKPPLAHVGSPLVSNVESIPLKSRGISQETCRKYGYGVTPTFPTHGPIFQVAPYHDAKGRVVAQKVRTPDKKFTITGDISKAGLFGQQISRAGGKMIVITEGEIDAMSVTEAMGLGWPALSVPNGAAGAAKALGKHLEFLESFEKVVLAFDDDEPGHKATEQCLQLFSPGKAAAAYLEGAKDPNELLKRSPGALRNAIWSAKVHRPDGVVNMADLYERVFAPLEMGLSYPWPGLNEKLFGFRPGEVITWTAGTGVGKSALVSEVVYHLLTELEVPTGIIYLEEGVDRAGKRIVGLDMDKPLHLPDTEYTKAEFDIAWERTLGTRRLEAYDHHGSLGERTLLDKMRFMAKVSGAKVLVLDHISMVVSGADLADDERRLLDHLMTSLVSLAEEAEVTIHLVSHLRRPPGSGSHEEGRQVSLSDLRGTQAIAQLSDTVIAAERNQQAEEAEDRKLTQLRILKNRYAGLTGPADRLQYNYGTGRLEVLAGEEFTDVSADY